MEQLFVIKEFDEEFRYGQAEFRDQVTNIDFQINLNLRASKIRLLIGELKQIFTLKSTVPNIA